MSDYNDLLGDKEDEQIKRNLGFTPEAVTYVGMVEDHSGSMGEPVNPMQEDSPIKKDLAMSNFNEQIATLKKDADDGMEVLMTVVEFDHEIKCPYENTPIEDVEPLEDYWTRGMTSLYDAIVYTISRIQSRMDTDKRSNKAALIIIDTDGYENNSSDYQGVEGRKRLRDLIKDLEDTGQWTFTFLGAGLDEKFAQRLGMSFGNTITTRQGNVKDIVYAYAAQAAGTKNYMNDRKKGWLNKTDFYNSDGGSWDENDKDI